MQETLETATKWKRLNLAIFTSKASKMHANVEETHEKRIVVIVLVDGFCFWGCCWGRLAGVQEDGEVRGKFGIRGQKNGAYCLDLIVDML